MVRVRSAPERCAPGDRVGNYVIEHELGPCGAGVLYEVAHVVLPRRAVMKVMHAALAAYPAFAVQLLREACLLEAMRHPGIPKVFESGRLADGRPYFTAELVEGEPLAEVLAGGPLEVDDVIALVRDLAELLEHAHRRGVVHRSLMPERVVLADRAWVTDWSDARTHDAATSIPHVPTPGSRNYVAPELVRGDAVDDRADIYALGVIAYQALTGELPFAIATLADGVTPHAPVATRCTLPPGLATLVDQMLARDRFDRPTSAEVRVALEVLTPAPLPPPRARKLRWTPAFGTATPDEPPDDFGFAPS